MFTLSIVLALSATLSGQSPAQAPEQKPDATAAISGVVVDGTSGEPVEDATVTLAGAGAAGLLQTRQFSDQKGRFVFVNLRPGLDYTLTALASGYFNGSFSRDRGPSDQRIAIPLKADEWVRDVRVTVWKPGSISGQVVDETGSPMVGVFVRVLSRVQIAGRDHLATGPVTITDDRGIYRVTGLTAGRYFVEVPSVQSPAPAAMPTTPVPFGGINGRYPWSAPAGPDGRERGYPITFYPSARTAADATNVDVRLAEERAGVDIALNPVPLFKVAGTIQGRAEGLTLRLIPAGLESLGSGGEAAQSPIAGDGAFQFAGVPAGNYVIDVRRRIPEVQNTLMMSQVRLPQPLAPRGSAMSSFAVHAAAPGTSFAEAQFGSNQNASTGFARLPIVLSNADLIDVSVTLRNGGVLDGRLVIEVAPDKPDARPAPFLTALILEPASGQPELGTASARPDLGPVGPPSVVRALEGTVHFEGLGAGEYLLRIFSSSKEWILKSVVWNGQDYTHRPFDASASLAISGVIVTMTNKVAAITGSVKEKDAAIILFPVAPSLWSNYGFNPPFIKSAFAGGDGGFRFDGLAAGDYFAVAVDPANRMAWLEPGFFARMAPLASRVSVGWGEAQNVSLAIVAVRR